MSPINCFVCTGVGLLTGVQDFNRNVKNTVRLKGNSGFEQQLEASDDICYSSGQQWLFKVNCPSSLSGYAIHSVVIIVI